MSESEEEKTKTYGEILAEMIGKYPPKDLPIIFADYVPSASWQGGVVKFYFIRNDPSISADLTNSPQLVAQVAMPISGFASTVIFFEEQLKKMVTSGDLKSEVIEAARAFYRKRREEEDVAKS
jgi:hypothetical protein